MTQVLEQGLQRLKDKGSWKLWRWPGEDREFLDGEAFREWYRSSQVEEELRPYLANNDPTQTEKPAEAGFRQRMSELAQKIQQRIQAMDGELSGAQAARPGRRLGARPGAESSGGSARQLKTSHVEVIHMVMEAFEREPECLYDWLSTAVNFYVIESLSAEHRETNIYDLAYEDLFSAFSVGEACCCCCRRRSAALKGGGLGRTGRWP